MNAREEIEQAAKIIETYEIPGSAGIVKSIREILATHELVPIDETPFDPERCGFIKLDHPYREESYGRYSSQIMAIGRFIKPTCRGKQKGLYTASIYHGPRNTLTVCVCCNCWGWRCGNEAG